MKWTNSNKTNQLLKKIKHKYEYLLIPIVTQDEHYGVL